MRHLVFATTALVAACVLAAACSSSSSASPTSGAKKKDSDLGVRVLDCVVVEREEGAPSSSGSRGYSGTGDYYMVFETKEGDATARYRLSVNRTQWFRFPEGSHVRITLNNNILTDIRSNE